MRTLMEVLVNAVTGIVGFVVLSLFVTAIIWVPLAFMAAWADRGAQAAGGASGGLVGAVVVVGGFIALGRMMRNNR